VNLGGNLVEENVVVVIGLLAKNARRQRRKYMTGMEGLLEGLFGVGRRICLALLVGFGSSHRQSPAVRKCC
jgi:hypothetical protein